MTKLNAMRLVINDVRNDCDTLNELIVAAESEQQRKSSDYRLEYLVWPGGLKIYARLLLDVPGLTSRAVGTINFNNRAELLMFAQAAPSITLRDVTPTTQEDNGHD